MKYKSDKDKLDYLFYLIRFGYSDLNVKRCRELSESLFNYIKSNRTDREISDMLYDIFHSTSQENIEGFPVSNKEFSRRKVSEIKKTITSKYLKKQEGKVLVDVGAGDCSLSKSLAEENNMTAIAIDIKSDVDWGSAGFSACDTISHIYYDGSNLMESVKSVAGSREIGLITYNHALHHFGSFNNMRNSLKQAYELLAPGGILFIKEHDKCKADDIDINLQHIILSHRYTMDKFGKWDKDQLWKYMDNFIKTYSAHFFTKNQLINMCRSVGFKLVNVRDNVWPYKLHDFKDISMAKLYVFTK